MSVSAAMIIKNSERCVSRCLDSILTAVDEIIVVDTGSTDRSIQIVESYVQKYDHVKLFHFEWVNDFSAARNYSLDQVSNEWVFIVDSDDVLPLEDHHKIRSYVDSMNSIGQKCVYDIIYDNTVAGEIVEVIPVGYVRLFPSNLRYKDMIHEQITFGDIPRIQSDIHLLHDGYDINLVDIKAKKKRNIELLIKNLGEDNDNARLWLHLGREMSVIDKEKATRYLNIAQSKANNPELLNLIIKEKNSL
ncbi:glycosyltransferase family 2 protein [Paenibacillus crassostreae]|uniref:Glycosyltransferase 2-like domain-containing protein n=1 Tax=Paenibacillus crassostreae TaxID=1763538 RepID=A0A162RQR9_9BACL|nr:glycosyltransferase family 2 protein [Paenibacillus crassostreae]AOZ93244.1 hypothetical protein LPB68_14180 [Paenibacillus crassostreae]OAB74067.1 hypothetical protein PNBC_13020 [Paenibacillus crassostreae]